MWSLDASNPSCRSLRYRANPRSSVLSIWLLPDLRVDGFHRAGTSIDCVLLSEVKMAEDIKAKLESYRTAPFDARFPNTNQSRNCYVNYLGKSTPQGRCGWLTCNYQLTQGIKTLQLSSVIVKMIRLLQFSYWPLTSGLKIAQWDFWMRPTWWVIFDTHYCCFSVYRLPPLPESVGC